MHRYLTSALVIGAITLAGCGSSDPVDSGPGLTAAFRVLNGVASSPSLGVTVDAQPIISSIDLGIISPTVRVLPGLRQIGFFPNGGAVLSAAYFFDALAGIVPTIVALDSLGIVNATVLDDPGAIGAPGIVQVRVAHYAPNAPAVRAFLRVPDTPELVSPTLDFSFKAVSDFVVGQPGDWELLLTTPSATDTVFTTGPFTMAGGSVRSVVILDDAPPQVRATFVDPPT